MAEGFGSLVYMEIYNSNKDTSYEWDNIDEWLTENPKAGVGDEIYVYAQIQNTGDDENTIWAEFSSSQVIPNENSYQEDLVPSGEPTPANWPFLEAEWSFTMPNDDVNIKITAGHIE